MPIWPGAVTDLHTTVPVVETSANGVLTLVVDASTRLGEGEAIAAATATLADRSSGAAVADAFDSVEHDAASVTLVLAAGLTPGRGYRAEVLCTVAPTKVEPILFDVDCVA